MRKIKHNKNVINSVVRNIMHEIFTSSEITNVSRNKRYLQLINQFVLKLNELQILLKDIQAAMPEYMTVKSVMPGDLSWYSLTRQLSFMERKMKEYSETYQSNV